MSEATCICGHGAMRHGHVPAIGYEGACADCACNGLRGDAPVWVDSTALFGVQGCREMEHREAERVIALWRDRCKSAESRVAEANGKLNELAGDIATRDRRERELSAALEHLREALGFYADPDTYYAIGMVGDPPCGPFLDDLSDESDPGYPKPGKRARAALDALSSGSTGKER